MVVRVQTEKIQSGGKRIKGFKARVGREYCISRERVRWARLSSRGIQAGEVRGGSHCAGKCGISRRSRDAAGRAAPEVRAAKSSESRKGE